MQKRKYTEEMRLFVIENGKGCSSSDLTRLFNERFGTDFKESQITALRYSLGAKSGIDTRFKSGDETGAEYRFKKGQQCQIKGRKWDEYMPEESREKCRTECFAKDHRPHNWMPVRMPAPITPPFHSNNTAVSGTTAARQIFCIFI